MQAFQTAFRPSRLGLGIAVLLHSAALAVCLICFYGTARPAGAAALLFSFAHACRTLALKRQDAVRRITVGPQGKAVLQFDGGRETPAVLQPQSVVLRYALFLVWDAGGKTVRQAVLPDMADKAGWRRLTVWARWNG
ncbi:protein YgfX [Neisseria sp.]|uniref:protein YgfX n=1 Tax=Neisseria sp. TaxID=192066 RepID=UPI0035A01006